METHKIYDSDRAAGGKAIECLVCGLVSYNPKDVEELFCGFCKRFHGEVVLHPTGKCFDDALEFLWEKVKEKPSRRFSKTWKLVHGICLKDGNPYAHAWVHEGSRHVWFSSIIKGYKAYAKTKREAFFNEFEVQEWIEYSFMEAFRMNHLFGNFGPWIPKYRSLCKNGKEQ